MKRFLIRLILVAFAIDFVLPMLDGFTFQGNFFHAIGAGLFFSILCWIVEALAIALSAVLTITTMGFALLFLIPIWILGFWLLPAIGLKLLADLIPGFLTIQGWMPAIWGGLVMLLIGAITGDKPTKYRKIEIKSD